MKQSAFLAGLALLFLTVSVASAAGPELQPDQLAWSPDRSYRLQWLDSLRRTYPDGAIYDAFQRATASSRFDFADEARLRAYLHQAETLLQASFYRPNDESALLYEAMGD